MNMANMKIGVRLGLGFGLVLILMVTLITIGLLRFASIGDINDKIIEKDWVKADAAATINAMMRANARRTMELLLIPDKAQLNRVFEKVEENKKVIDSAVEILDKLIYIPEGKALMAKFKTERAQYVASFNKVGKLVMEDRRDEGRQIVIAETLPALDAVLGTVKALSDLQKKIVEASGEDARENILFARNLMIGLGAIAVLIGVCFALWITRSITRPLNEAVTIAQTVSAGDLTSHIVARTKDETGQLLQALKDMNDSLVKIVGEVRTGADTIATASTQIATGNLDLSSRTEQQASSLEETASSMEELTSTVKQNADNASQANGLVLTASEIAGKGGAVVAQVVETMSSINDSSKKIVDIIGVIDGIAFQTNILALNAAVEAARAGEQGRGFAVVASEVRNLAQRSAAAAKEIKALIDTSVEKVDAGAKLVNQAGATMDEIVESVKRVTDIMAEITAASQEQTSGIEQINQAVMQMDQVTQQNASLVEEAAAASESLQDQATNLTRVVGVFKMNGMHAAASIAAVPHATKPQTAPVTPLPKKAPRAGIASGDSAHKPTPAKRITNAQQMNRKEWEEL
ncbi:MAG: methyl-accepting chemotaxis protein [Noviherbaspirillum sp.]